jgi:ABC-2 type transport system ATP-binding protein
MNEMISLENVTKTYKDKTVVDKLSLSVGKGEVFALLGANGAGKTTTIKMILGLAKVSSGNIKIADGTKIGYSPETPYFPPYLTAMEVLSYYAGIEGDKSKKDKSYLKKLLDVTGLEDTKTKVKNYSKGMIQRLALAQALIADPDILILDEPTAGLDPAAAKDTMALFKKINEEGATVILVTHDMDLVASYCDEVVVMEGGKVEAQCAPSKLFGRDLSEYSLQNPHIFDFALRLKKRGIDLDMSEIRTTEDLAKAIAKRCKHG